MIISEDTSRQVSPKDEWMALCLRDSPSSGLTPFPTPPLAASTRLTKVPIGSLAHKALRTKNFTINNAFSIFNPIPQQPLNQTPPYDVAPHQSPCNLYPALQKHRRSPLPLFASRTARQCPILHCSIDASCWDTAAIRAGYHGTGLCVIISVLGR
jgi:hypothetical protein